MCSRRRRRFVCALGSNSPVLRVLCPRCGRRRVCLHARARHVNFRGRDATRGVRTGRRRVCASAVSMRVPFSMHGVERCLTCIIYSADSVGFV